MNRPAAGASRREFLALGWFPFFGHRRHVEVAGIPFEAIRRGNSKRRYLRIHGNEETAREVLTEHMKTHRGRAYIVESHQRNLAVDGGALDPNRMFSRVGAEANLKRQNPGWDAGRIRRVLDRLDKDRKRLEQMLFPPAGGLLIALHNNGPGYSVRDEVGISDATSLADEANPHEFFLCTDARDYAVLKTSPYNAVWQAKAPPDDDGSLSRLCALRGIRYVNLEAGAGQRARQAEMLDWGESHLAT